jgi:hypothetical protein
MRNILIWHEEERLTKGLQASAGFLYETVIFRNAI